MPQRMFQRGPNSQAVGQVPVQIIEIDKISLKNLQTHQTLFIIFLLDMSFENLIVELHVPYILDMYVKFCSN